MLRGRPGGGPEGASLPPLRPRRAAASGGAPERAREGDDVVVVNLVYHLRLDSFRAVGQAADQGYVAVHSVAGRRKVSSRAFTVVVAYPGDVTKEAVIQSELGARAKGSTVPIEEVELGLLDAAVKLNSKDGSAFGQRAWIKAGCPDARFRDGKQAVEDATEACKLTGWTSGGELGALAAAYAEIGDFKHAVKIQKQAMETAERADPDWLERSKKRLQLYEAQKPYRLE